MKSTIKITIEANGDKFSLNLAPSLFGKFSVKVGRTPSKKHRIATLTEVFELLRVWTVKHAQTSNLNRSK